MLIHKHFIYLLFFFTDLGELTDFTECIKTRITHTQRQRWSEHKSSFSGVLKVDITIRHQKFLEHFFL